MDVDLPVRREGWSRHRLESLKTHQSGKTHPWGKFQEKEGVPILSKHLQSTVSNNKF